MPCHCVAHGFLYLCFLAWSDLEHQMRWARCRPFLHHFWVISLKQLPACTFSPGCGSYLRAQKWQLGAIIHWMTKMARAGAPRILYDQTVLSEASFQADSASYGGRHCNLCVKPRISEGLRNCDLSFVHEPCDHLHTFYLWVGGRLLSFLFFLCKLRTSRKSSVYTNPRSQFQVVTFFPSNHWLDGIQGMTEPRTGKGAT